MTGINQAIEKLERLRVNMSMLTIPSTVIDYAQGNIDEALDILKKIEKVTNVKCEMDGCIANAGNVCQRDEIEIMDNHDCEPYCAYFDEHGDS